MRADRWAARVFLAAAVLAVAVLGGGVFFLAERAAVFFSQVPAARFFLGEVWAPPAAYGLLPFLGGSLLVTFLALGLAFFPGLATALYITGGGKGGRLLRLGLEVLGGIPAVVLGWLALGEILPFLGSLTGTGGFGPGAAGIILAVMVLPTFALLAIRALEKVPSVYREAALALGAKPWTVLRGVVLPLAWEGIRSALILAATRALGETMAVQVVVGNAPVVPAGLFVPAATLTSWIATEMGHAPYGTPAADSLFALGLVLLGLALVGAHLARGKESGAGG